LVSGQSIDALELLRYGMKITHLEKYGIVTLGKGNVPEFHIDCVRNYVRFETARREGRRYLQRQVPNEQREHWREVRLANIYKDLKLVNRLSSEVFGFKLFLSESVGNADEFFHAPVVTSMDQLRSFLVVMHRCLVEAIEICGSRNKVNGFFYGEFGNKMPALHAALERLRVYRHAVCHTELYPAVKDRFEGYLIADFGAKDVHFDSENAWVVQQIVLDEIMYGIQVELAKLST
jgi:hypothetical protein